MTRPAGGVVLMAPVELEWSLDVPDGFLRTRQRDLIDDQAMERFRETGGTDMEWLFPSQVKPTPAVWLDASRATQSHHTLNPLLAVASSPAAEVEGARMVSRWLVYPMGIAVVIIEFTAVGMADTQPTFAGEEDIDDWWEGFRELSGLDAETEMRQEVAAAKAHLNEAGAGLHAWTTLSRTSLDGALSWIHTVKWADDPQASSGAPEVRSGSSLLLCATDGEADRRSSYLWSAIETLALGQALWFFKDLADSESVLRTADITGGGRVADQQISEERAWLLKVNSVPGLVASITTSLPPGPLAIWKQSEEAWDTSTIDAALEEKVENYSQYLSGQSRRNQARREKSAELILAVVAISALASLIGDLAAQLTDEPVEFLGVSSSRWPVIFLMLMVFGLAYLLLKKSDN